MTEFRPRSTPPPPPPTDGPKSWREIGTMILIALQLLAGPMLAIAGIFFVFGLGLWALANRPILTVIPVAVLVSFIWWFASHHAVAAENLEDELFDSGRHP